VSMWGDSRIQALKVSADSCAQSDRVTRHRAVDVSPTSGSRASWPACEILIITLQNGSNTRARRCGPELTVIQGERVAIEKVSRNAIGERSTRQRAV
jgi:hypothetical protein